MEDGGWGWHILTWQCNSPITFVSVAWINDLFQEKDNLWYSKRSNLNDQFSQERNQLSFSQQMQHTIHQNQIYVRTTCLFPGKATQIISKHDTEMLLSNWPNFKINHSITESSSYKIERNRFDASVSILNIYRIEKGGKLLAYLMLL